jgi:predicted ATPase
MLILLCDLAAADEDSLVAIDEPENSLHPFAIREFLRRANAWAQQRRLTVLLATHSPVLLDEMTGRPEQVFVLHPNRDGPTRIDEAHNPRWLANFRIGELYADGELGSNDEP